MENRCAESQLKRSQKAAVLTVSRSALQPTQSASGSALQPTQHSLSRRKFDALEQHCARLKQQKRVAEKFATAAQAETEAAKHHVAAMTQRLEDLARRAQYYERLAEQRLGEVNYLRGKWDTSFQARVEQDVFRAVEATGDARLFPYSLTPTLAAVQSKVGGAALQRRAARLTDPGVHPLGLHPGVHEWASFEQLKPEFDRPPPEL